MSSRENAADNIVAIINHHSSADTDLSDVAHALSQDHAHRPGAWQEDLKKANQALHDKGILGGMDIVSMKGQDLVTRDHSGGTELRDSSDITSKRQLNAPSHTSDIDGRHASLNPDGSGTVQAKSGDNRQWDLSRDLLKAHGVEHPTANQMANFQKELEEVNGKSVSQFRPGDKIKVPPAAQGGDHTAFSVEHADRRVEQQVSEAKDAFHKFATPGFHMPRDNKDMTNMDQTDIARALNQKDLTAADRSGLKFLSDHYSELESPSSDNGTFRAGIYNEGFDKYKAKVEQINHLDPRSS